jgi:peptidoglycan-associated lipoprotein
MIKSSSTIVLPLTFSAFVLIGCTSTATPKPEANTSSPSSSQGSSGQKPVQQTRQANPGSSLEAHREGKAPASGPLKDIYFDFDKYDLRTDARSMLQDSAKWLKANPAARIQIEGHCDERGTTEYNMALGAKRAQAAKDYLGSLGIQSQRVSTVSYGEELPVCRDHTDQCYEKNRHDRFVVTNAPPTS